MNDSSPCDVGGGGSGGGGGVPLLRRSYLSLPDFTCRVETPKAPRTAASLWRDWTLKQKKKKEKPQRTMESPLKDSPVSAGFHRQEVQKTTWDVPERYTALRSVGSGAYGTVW